MGCHSLSNTDNDAYGHQNGNDGNRNLYNKNIIYNKDTNSKIVFYFYPNGDTFIISQYYKDKRNGIFRRYYPNKRMDCDGLYKVGRMDSIWNFYYPNGSIRSILNFTNDSLFLGQYDYDSLGNLEKYSYYFNNRWIYKRIYSADRSIKQDMGSILGFVTANKPIHYTGDSLVITYYIPIPPKDSINLYIYLSNNKKIEKARYRQLVLKNTMAVFDDRLSYAGKYFLHVKFQRFKNGSTIPLKHEEAVQFTVLPKS